MCPFAAAVALAFTISYDPIEADEIRMLNAELARFVLIDLDVAKSNSGLNDSHREWLEFLMEVSPSDKLSDWYDECLIYGTCWGALVVAKSPGKQWNYDGLPWIG
jgi:hypothetical protein